MNIQNKTILITGASSGIGRALAIELAKFGNRIAITARREVLLNEVAEAIQAAGGDCLVLPGDALDANQAEQDIENTIKQFGSVDIAVLNIGDGPAFNMSTAGADAISHNMRLNYDTMVNYLVPLVRIMKDHNHGMLVHTNSLAGFLGLPMQGPYSAAKAAGRILLDTCRIELETFNIKVISLYPGFIATARVADDGIPAPFEMTEAEAVNHMIHAIDKEKSEYLFPFSLRWLIRLARVLPKPVTKQVLKRAIPDDY